MSTRVLRGVLLVLLVTATATAGGALAGTGPAFGDVLPAEGTLPPPPKPEAVKVEELPLPPTAPSAAVGSCTEAVNRRRTGCIASGPDAMQSGGYLPDGNEVSATITFAGAPAAPDPASVYSGRQLIIVKADGTKFANGDAWKCVTCGVPAANALGISSGNGTFSAALDYPQPFADGKRILAGTDVIDCTPRRLIDPKCTPETTHVFPLRWNVTADGSGAGGNMRELRLNPDNVHIGFNHIVFDPVLGQQAYLGRLEFDPSPATGAPLAPRYDVTKVVELANQKPSDQLWSVDPAHEDQLVFNPLTPSVGELRGFSKDGKEVLYIGAPAESDNIDVFATNLSTGATRRVTRNPDYTDPVDLSPDGKWAVAMDTRISGRQLFMSGMQNVPPLTDMVTTALVSSIRNNHQRRFFQPILIDRAGDRGSYQGQQLDAGSTKPGAVGDPNWNGEADPRWSPDGTAVAYWQALVTAPACGGPNPLPCPTSTEPGGRRVRLMVAHLTGRTPGSARKVAPIPDDVPWGTPYVPGTTAAPRPHFAAGRYTVHGKKSGIATVDITEDAARDSVNGVSVSYQHYSDDGAHIIDGTESVEGGGQLDLHAVWHSDLTQTGKHHGTKVTSEPGGFVVDINLADTVLHATGTLTTTIDGHVYTQPANGT